MRPAALFQFRYIRLHRVPDATGIDEQPSFPQNFGDVRAGERVTQVPTYACRITRLRYWRLLNGFVGVIGMDFLRTDQNLRDRTINRVLAKAEKCLKRKPQ